MSDFDPQNYPPDLDTVQEFLAEWCVNKTYSLGAIEPKFPNKPEPVTVWFTAQNLEEALGFVTRQAAMGRNLYVQLNPANPQKGPWAKARKSDILGGLCIQGEMDPPPSAFGPATLLAWQNATCSALVDGTVFADKGLPRPTLLTFSGSGFMYAWRLNQPVMFQTPTSVTVDREKIEDVEVHNRALIDLLGSDEQSATVEHLMRLPGTWNFPSAEKIAKGRTKPELSVILDYDNTRTLSPAQFAAFPVGKRKEKGSGIATPQRAFEGLPSPEHREAAIALMGDEWPPPRTGSVKGTRHYAALNLTGILARMGWDDAANAEFTDAVVVHAGGASEIGKRLSAARSSREKVAAGEPATGWPAMSQYIKEDVLREVQILLGVRVLPTEAEADAFAAALVAAGIEATQPEPGSFAADVAVALRDVERLLKVTTNTPDVKPLFMSAGELFNTTFPRTLWLAKGLVKRGGLLMVGGEAKTGKSWILKEIATAVASGTKVFGEFETGEPTKVAYFFAEDLGRDIQSHLGALSAGRGLDPRDACRNLHVQPRGEFVDLLHNKDLALIVASCRRIGDVGLLCIEPLVNIHSGEENEADSMRDVMKRLQIIGELLGCTIAVAHHLKKDADGKRGGQSMRGSGVMHGSLDSGIYMSGLKNTGAEITNNIEVEIKGARGAGKFKLTLKLDDDADGTSVRAEWAVERAETASDKPAEPPGGIDHERLGAVVEYLCDRHVMGEPTTTYRQIHNELKGSRKSVDAAVRVAKGRGYVADCWKGSKQTGVTITPAGEAFNRGEIVGLDLTPVAPFPSVVPPLGGETVGARGILHSGQSRGNAGQDDDNVVNYTDALTKFVDRANRGKTGQAVK